MIILSHTTEIILLFGNNSMALFSNHTPFSFAKKMIVIDIVFFFFFITGMQNMYEANQISAFTEKKK